MQQLDGLYGLYGPVIGGTLRLCGSLQRIRLKMPRNQIRANLRAGRKIDTEVAFNTIGGRPLYFQVALDAELDDRIYDINAGNSLFCMLVKWDKLLAVALLFQFINHSSGRFRRVGLIYTYPIGSVNNIHDFRKPDEEAANLPCVEYDADTGLHTIDVE